MRISDVYQSIIASYDDWNGFLINPSYARNDYEVSWGNRIAGIRKTIVRESDVLNMAENHQYTFQISDDGSLIQLYYRFDQRTKQIDGANLAFYRAYSEQESIAEEFLLAEYGVTPLGDAEMTDTEEGVHSSFRDPPVGWMRIDYDPNAKERGIIHHDCHMHLSNFADARFIMSGVPSPRQFIELVVASVYPAKYEEHRLELGATSNGGSRTWGYRNPQQINNLNQESMPLDGDPIYNQLTHFRVPS